MSPRSLILLSLICIGAMAADWPHRNGPYRNNQTTEVVKSWKGPLEPAWQIPLGEGYSSPTVAEGRLFLHAKVKDKDEEEVLAFDAASGKPLWRVSYPHKPFESNVGNGRGRPRSLSAARLRLRHHGCFDLSRSGNRQAALANESVGTIPGPDHDVRRVGHSVGRRRSTLLADGRPGAGLGGAGCQHRQDSVEGDRRSADQRHADFVFAAGRRAGRGAAPGLHFDAGLDRRRHERWQHFIGSFRWRIGR